MSLALGITLTALTGAIAVAYIVRSAQLLDDMERKMKDNMKK